jgi:uncharacterized protein DUF4236
MGFRFQRRLTLFPGVRLNFSRHGISTSIGPRGASITLGRHGATMNLGVPGTGVSYRQSLGGGDEGRPGAPRPTLAEAPQPTTAVASAPVSEVTTEGLEGLKQLITEALAERESLRRAVPQAREALAVAEGRLRRAQSWFFGLFIGKQVPHRKEAVESRAAELKAQEERLAGAVIDLQFTLDPPTVAAFTALTEAFEQLAGCQAIWDVTAERYEDTRVTRSSAARNVERQGVRFDVSEDAVLQSDAKVLRLKNANGADLLVYPGFLMLVGSGDLALVELRDVEVAYSQVRFTESDTVPSDAEVVGQTWAKCNKDGSPDRRFKGNYQIPVAGYGGLVLKTANGLNEEYLVSNSVKAARFAEAFSDYKRCLRELSARAPAAGAPQPNPPVAKAPEQPPAAPVYVWKSLPFLQASDPASPQHAIKLMEQFIQMLKADVEGFGKAKHSMAEWEAYIRTLASAPGVLRVFLARSPDLAPFASNLIASVSTMTRDAVAQVRKSIEGAGPAVLAESDAQGALRAAREAEQALRA